MTPTFLDHLDFNVSSIAATERFYTPFLGTPKHHTAEFVVYKVGDTLIFFTAPLKHQQHPFEKDNIGLNHLAFGCRTRPALEAIASQLDAANISHSGIKIDSHGKKDYIWLNDPDGFRVEFYLREA